jgi:hypothetical protein
MTTRRQFLIASSAAAALTPAIALADATPAPKAPAAKASPIPKFVFDRARFDAMISKKAKHRHAYAAEGLDDGQVCYTMTNVLDAYDSMPGEKPASAISAAVLYHGSALGLGFNDKVWNELIIPSIPKMSKSMSAALGDVKKGDGNPWLHKPKGDDYDGSIETLVARGAAFFLCNNATTGFAHIVADALGLTPAGAYAKLAGGLVPNALLVPAGVWAIHALQEAHFTYQQVTLT